MTNIAKLTAELERRIIETALDAMLATGCAVSVEYEWNDVAPVLEASRNRAAILDALFSQPGAEFLVLLTPTSRGCVIYWKREGWVQLKEGNGSDVIVDFTHSLELVLAAANKLAEDYS